MKAGFLLIDKPKGWTSHDVVAKVRSYLGGKVGHAGTLDPMATGLLVLGVGGATRLLRFIQESEKEYLATALFGVATDSLDADGEVISREPLPVTFDEVDEAMQHFRGEIMQVPPMVSARRVEGRRLYELAREGRVVEREARPVTISRLDLIDLAPSDYPEITFRTICSTGTYVRTLADDLACALGGRAHLTALRRVRTGSLDVSDAVSIDEVAASGENGEIERHLLAPSAALIDLPEIRVDEAAAVVVRNGCKLPESLYLDGVELGEPISDLGAPIRVCDSDGGLIAVYSRGDSSLNAEVVLS